MPTLQDLTKPFVVLLEEVEDSQSLAVGGALRSGSEFGSSKIVLLACGDGV